MKYKGLNLETKEIRALHKMKFTVKDFFSKCDQTRCRLHKVFSSVFLGKLKNEILLDIRG